MGAPEKIWYQSLNSRNRYLANLAPRAFPHPFFKGKALGTRLVSRKPSRPGEGGGGGKGATPNPSAWFDKEKNLWHSGYLVTVPTALLPWVPEVFLACSRSHERRSAGHYKDLTETGNRARKVSGTQGTALFVTQFL